jgi:hypothetical protein
VAHEIALEDEVRIYLLSDRQWKREQRESHARYMLGEADTLRDKAFWRAVLNAVTLPKPMPRRAANDNVPQ